MKTKRIAAALLCATLGFAATVSFAQPAPGGPGQSHDDQGNHGNHGGPGGPGPGDHGGSAHGPDHGPDRGPQMSERGHDAPHGPQHADAPPPHHPDWRRGQRLSSDYRDREYVVDDWHDHGLRQPPRGYQWVGVGGDYLLVAVTSGIIAQVIFSQ
jgi:Ni/Co efflux regulator RcnB